MKDQTYLTIVVSYFNLRFFEDTLKSLILQEDQNFKILIGNDKSPENPEHIIEKYQKNRLIDYIVFDENMGGKDLTLQWKRCLEHVDTPYFMILGDDDMISENATKEINRTIQETEGLYNVFRLCIQRIDENGEKISNIIRYKDNETSTSFIVKRAKNEVISSLGEYIFSTQEYKKVGIKSFPKAFYSDNMMVLEISNFKAIKNVDNAISFIRVSKHSFSGNSDNEIHIRDAAALFHYELVEKYSDKFSNNELKYFLPYIFYGYKNKILSINLSKVLKLVFKFKGVDILVKILIQKMKRA
jgi:hypothetical protein